MTKQALKDHPRIRGEHPYRSGSRRRQSGSSPHTRGAPQPHQTRNAGRRIIPAYAGSTMISTCGAGIRADHPRIRGEHEKPRHKKEFIPGSSPHTRGARLMVDDGIDSRRIIPAYAGSTRARTRIPHLVQDHPRIRGEHGDLPHALSACGGSSPHTRGARVQMWILRVAGGIIPAYAGSTCRCR